MTPRTALTTALVWAVLVSARVAPAGEPLRWEGRISIETPVEIRAGETVVVAEGTTIAVGPGGGIRVAGRLYALGTRREPVRLEGNPDGNRPAIEIARPGAVVRLQGTEVSGARRGIFATNGVVVLAGCEFSGNGTGVEITMQARAVIRDTRFSDNRVGLTAGNGGAADGVRLVFDGNRTGLATHNSARLRLRDATFTGNDLGYGQKNACDAQLDGCTFQNNEVAMQLTQTRRSPFVRFSRFEGNRTGIGATSASHLRVEASAFRNNDVAFRATEFCGPLLRFNTFENNREAVRLDHKSGGRIKGNRFEQNGVALSADFSSYPRVSGNRFVDNGWHVKLGRFMSADWERRQGSGGITLGKAAGRNTRNPLMLRGNLPDAAGTVDLSGNAWDEETLAEIRQGPETNLSRVWDGRDEPTVTYPDWGTGDEPFRLDVVAVAPALTAPPPVGPEAWIPLDTRPLPEPQKGPGAPDRTGPGR